ncbi:MAG TPA: hypothetical protein VGR45_03805 [Stellaceae bacterium]|nr:hypothetical protein [Stellaceae bacterium]
MELIRGLVERVELRPVGSGFEIELIDEIANMVALGGGTCQSTGEFPPLCADEFG